MATMKERWEAAERLAKIEAVCDSGWQRRQKRRDWPDRLWTWFLSRIWNTWVTPAWRQMKEADQRKAKGFANAEAWNFYRDHAKWCFPRLLYLRDNFTGMPLKPSSGKAGEPQWAAYTSEEWREILHKMCRGFYFIRKRDEDLSVDYDPLTRELIEEGLKLFAVHYLDLWD